MNELSTNPEYEALLFLIQQLETELAELVQERDKLTFHICPKLQTEYMLSVGKLEYAVFEYQCKILRIRRKIEIMQAFMNREQYTTEEQHGQFTDAVNAYKNANLFELRIIYLLLEKTSVTKTENSMDKLIGQRIPAPQRC